ncbi:hypothetical protein SESBI_15150 [Sesbania bispinosa]|nr:hypothetical protein SESBI_15150 [Sesbania bispinosa]
MAYIIWRKKMRVMLLKNKESSDKLSLPDAEVKKVEQLKTDLEAVEKKSSTFLQEKKDLEEKFSALEIAHMETVSAKKMMKSVVRDLTEENKNLLEGKELLEAEIFKVRIEVAMQHTKGFDKAIHQVRFLYPNLKLEEVGVFKHIVERKLVDIAVDDDED